MPLIDQPGSSNSIPLTFQLLDQRVSAYLDPINGVLTGVTDLYLQLYDLSLQNISLSVHDDVELIDVTINGFPTTIQHKHRSVIANTKSFFSDAEGVCIFRTFNHGFESNVLNSFYTVSSLIASFFILLHIIFLLIFSFGQLSLHRFM